MEHSFHLLIKDRTPGPQKSEFADEKKGAHALKCSHILTNRQRREIITYKNKGTLDHPIRVLQLPLLVQISGSGVL